MDAYYRIVEIHKDNEQCHGIHKFDETVRTAEHARCAENLAVARSRTAEGYR